MQAERAGAGDFVGGDAGDPPAAVAAREGRRRGLDVARRDPRAERQPGEDDDLVDGVVAFDVAARVRLRVAAALRLAEDVGVGGAVLAHGGQDEVGRPVDDPADLADLVGGQVLRDRRENRRPAADGGFETEGAPVRARQRFEFGAMVGDDVLVGGDDGLAGREGGGDEGVGGLVAAHQFDDDVVVVGRDDVRGRVGDDGRRDAGGDDAVGELVGHGSEGQGRAVERRQPFGSFEEGANHGSAHGTRAEHGDAKGFLTAGHARIVPERGAGQGDGCGGRLGVAFGRAGGASSLPFAGPLAPAPANRKVGDREPRSRPAVDREPRSSAGGSTHGSRGRSRPAARDGVTSPAR